MEIFFKFSLGPQNQCFVAKSLSMGGKYLWIRMANPDIQVIVEMTHKAPNQIGNHTLLTLRYKTSIPLVTHKMMRSPCVV